VSTPNLNDVKSIIEKLPLGHWWREVDVLVNNTYSPLTPTATWPPPPPPLYFGKLKRNKINRIIIAAD